MFQVRGIMSDHCNSILISAIMPQVEDQMSGRAAFVFCVYQARPSLRLQSQDGPESSVIFAALFHDWCEYVDSFAEYGAFFIC
jgi:hypothetical protein